MNGFDFVMPLALLLLPLPLAMWLLPARNTLPAGALRIPASISQRLAQGKGTGMGVASPWLAFVAWLALLLALAGPRIVAVTPGLPVSGRDIMLALDLSGSMLKQDFFVDGKAAGRIDALKHVGTELIRRRAGDRIGLVIFAELAFAASPLSFDVAAVSRTLEEASIGLVGRSTAIGDGLGLALKRLSDSPAPSRIIILLSDGANNAGSTDPLGVAALAKTMGVRLYTIGLGINDTSTPTDDPDAVDFDALRQLADIGGGQAFRVHTTAELDAAARAIEALVAGQSLAPPSVIRRDLWVFPAALGLLTLLAMAFARRGMFRREGLA